MSAGDLYWRLRDWWYDATHADCPVCGLSVSAGREWRRHKAAHDPVPGRSS